MEECGALGCPSSFFLVVFGSGLVFWAFSFSLS